MAAPNLADQLERQLDLIEYVAIALAKSHGLDFNEHCALEADPNGSCDSSTCVAAWNEDHDPSLCRDQYRKDARTALGAINQCSVGYPTLFAVVITETMAELQRAVVKFPTWPTDPLHAVAVLGEEFGELTKAVLQSVYEPHKVRVGEVRAEAVQTAAMAIRFIASLDAYAYAPGNQHSQTGAPEVVA